MSKAVKVVKADEIKTSGGQTEGMIRQNAIVDVCDDICSSGTYLPASSHLLTYRHSNASQTAQLECNPPPRFGKYAIPLSHSSLSAPANDLDTIIYAVRGHGSVVSDGGKTRQDLGPGDFALIPAFAEHQEVNDGDEEVLWVIVRSGRSPIVENLDGWGASSASKD